jgi:cell wall-associated NlpC family hydrolase
MAGMSLACPRVRRTLLNTAILGVLTTSTLVGFGATGALASTSVASTSVLRSGSSGSAVTVLQAKLGVAQDGVFGARTAAAVVAFQRAHGLAADGVVGPATRAALGSGGGAVTVQSASYPPSSGGSGIVGVAASLAGRPYRYGAAGPSGFDCSGLVQYAYGRVGVSLPRTTAGQYAATRHVPASQMRPGDLVFVVGRGGPSHVGIYAGNGNWWVAAHTGTTVKLQRIYTSSIVVGRV